MNLTRFHPVRLAGILFTSLLLSGCAEAILGGVATGAVVASDKRTLGATIEDQQIEGSARRLVKANSALAQDNHFSFTSYNRVLLITGEIREERLKTELDQSLRAIPNLRRIHNELTVAAPSSSMSRMSDTYLTAKVKTRLLLEKDLNPNRFKVVSENGRVYLMGLCSRKDGNQAALVARKTAGVQAVVTLFEYLD